MRYSVMIVPIVLPVLFWAGYHYYKDRFVPEPPGQLLLAFVFGIGAFFLGKLMYAGLGLVGLRYDAYLLAESNLPGLFAYAVLAIGPIEELAKFLPFLVVVRKFPAFDEPIDGIIYASFIALGFAASENVMYFDFLSSGEALARGFAAPLVHIVFASVWGYNVGCASLAGRRLWGVSAVALGVTAMLHGTYDFLVIALPVFALPMSALLVLALWIWRLRLISNLNKAAAKGQ